jgi:hypothetical protein
LPSGTDPCGSTRRGGQKLVLPPPMPLASWHDAALARGKRKPPGDDQSAVRIVVRFSIYVSPS